MRKEIKKFQVSYLQILDENGKCDEKEKPKLANPVLKKIYEFMVLSRVFDEKALKLQRQGRIGTYAPIRGQEAQVASAMALGNESFIFPAFRENGVYLTRGVPPELLYLYWSGDERGSIYPKGSNIFPVSITVGAHPLHAVGHAMASNILKKKTVTATYFGDGATSEGDFHEAMNFAGVYKAPIVFICQNNQWAISLPFNQQTAAETIAQKAIAYGFEGVRVDGNDVFAVYKATQEAVKKAKSGKGPTLIECLTYRMGDHTTSDEAKRYRKVSDLGVWEKKDPIKRFEKYLLGKKIISEKDIKKIQATSEKKIEEAVNAFESMKPYPAEEIFNYLFAKPTHDLEEQKAELKRELASVPAVEEDKKPAKKSEVKEKGAGVVGELEEAE